MNTPHQLTLIPQPTRAGERERAMRDARLRAERGMDQSQSSAEWALPGWCAMAAVALRDFARNHSEPFTVEMARTALVNALPKPPDMRAFGKAAVMAIKAGYIQRIPELYLPAASSNGAPKAAYTRGTKA